MAQCMRVATSVNGSPQLGVNGLRSFHQLRGSRRALLPRPKTCPWKSLAASMTSGWSTTSRWGKWAAIGFIVSRARCSGEVARWVIGRFARWFATRSAIRTPRSVSP
ncbi:Uncharacterised protein [Mycobacteroides abscessus subsp. abscessus]|nr:Uncharacterised protein [Mycobacteroides abscessus subsp. abscessus]